MEDNKADFDMGEPQGRSKWRRFLSLALKVYAGVCMLLVTCCLGLWAWYFLLAPNSSKSGGPLYIGGINRRDAFLVSHSVYKSSEYPRRAGFFLSMGQALAEYVGETPMDQAELFWYLGTPDKFVATNVVSNTNTPNLTNRVALFAYAFTKPGASNESSVIAMVSDGKVESVVIHDLAQYERYGFQPLSVDVATNRNTMPADSDRPRQ